MVLNHVSTVETVMQPSLLSYPRQWLLSPELKPCSCSAKRDRSLILMKRCLRASMDGHVDIHLPAPSPPSTRHRLQHALNVTSKWIVSAIVVTVLIVWRDQDQVLWANIGSVLNAASSKLLKKFFNQQRPLTAVGLKADPGMPSSHAQSIGFLSLYAAFGVILCLGLNIPGLASASLALFCGSYVAWLRVAEGLHTHVQVMAGVGFGYSMAALWIVLWHYWLKEVVASSIVYHNILAGCAGLSILMFLVVGVSKWRFGDA